MGFNLWKHSNLDTFTRGLVTGFTFLIVRGTFQECHSTSLQDYIKIRETSNHFSVYTRFLQLQYSNSRRTMTNLSYLRIRFSMRRHNRESACINRHKAKALGWSGSILDFLEGVIDLFVQKKIGFSGSNPLIVSAFPSLWRQDDILVKAGYLASQVQSHALKNR
jgi:hypothetical protein